MAVPYMGSKISLMSKALIRYEGVLHNVNREDSTITLSQVQSLGTENRSTDHQIPARDEIFEYIIFKADDIAELTVCEPSNNLNKLQDPAILSAKSGGGSASTGRAPAPIGSRAAPTVQPPPQKPAQATYAPPTSYRAAAAMNIPPLMQQQPYQQMQRRGGGGYQPMPQRNYEQPMYNRGRGGGAAYRAGYDDGFNNQYNNYRGRGASTHNTSGGASTRGSQRGGNRSRGRGGGGGPPGAPKPTEKLKFDSDFDISESNQEFEKVMQALKMNDTDSKHDDEADDEVEELNGADNGDDESSQHSAKKCYDKKSSFFDSISCDALERQEGSDSRPNWKHERQVNMDTFGQSAVRYNNYRGRFRGRGRGYSHFRGRGAARGAPAAQ